MPSPSCYQPSDDGKVYFFGRQLVSLRPWFPLLVIEPRPHFDCPPDRNQDSTFILRRTGFVWGLSIPTKERNKAREAVPLPSLGEGERKGAGEVKLGWIRGLRLGTGGTDCALLTRTYGWILRGFSLCQGILLPKFPGEGR